MTPRPPAAEHGDGRIPSGSQSSSGRPAPDRSPSRSRTPRDRLGTTRRWSGLALSVLLVGHLLPLFVLNTGVYRLDWNTLAARWADLPWRVWDLALIWVGCGYAALVLWQQVDGRSGRTGRRLPTACGGVLVLAALVLGSFAVLTIDLDLG